MNFDFKIRSRRGDVDEHGFAINAHREMFRCYKGNSSTQSNPSSTTNIDDTRTAGSEGSIVLGSGSSGQVQVVNQDVSADVVERLGQQNADVANEALRQVSQAAVDTSRAASDAAAAASRDASIAASDSARAASDAAKAAVDAQERTSYESGQVVKGVADTALNVTGDIASKALDANRAVTGDALISIDKAVNSSIGAVSDANRSLSQTTSDVLNFRSKDTEDALKLVADVQQSTNDLIRYTNEQFTQKLASNAGDAPQNTVDNIVKYVTIAGTLLGAFALFRSTKKS